MVGKSNAIGEEKQNISKTTSRVQQMRVSVRLCSIFPKEIEEEKPLLFKSSTTRLNVRLCTVLYTYEIYSCLLLLLINVVHINTYIKYTYKNWIDFAITILCIHVFEIVLYLLPILLVIVIIFALSSATTQIPRQTKWNAFAHIQSTLGNNQHTYTQFGIAFAKTRIQTHCKATEWSKKNKIEKEEEEEKKFKEMTASQTFPFQLHVYRKIKFQIK